MSPACMGTRHRSGWHSDRGTPFMSIEVVRMGPAGDPKWAEKSDPHPHDFKQHAWSDSVRLLTRVVTRTHRWFSFPIELIQSYI